MDPVYQYIDRVDDGYLLQKALCIGNKYTVKTGFIKDREIEIYKKKKRLKDSFKTLEEQNRAVAQKIYDSNDADIKFSRLISTLSEARKLIEEEVSERKGGMISWL